MEYNDDRSEIAKAELGDAIYEFTCIYQEMEEAYLRLVTVFANLNEESTNTIDASTQTDPTE